MSFDEMFELQKEIERAQKEQENIEKLKASDNENDFGFSEVLKERQKKKDVLRSQLLSTGLDDEDIDRLFEIISKAEEEIEEVKRAFDYKARISGSAEKMYNDIIAIQKKMKIDFDEEFKKIYKAKMKKQ